MLTWVELLAAAVLGLVAWYDGTSKRIPDPLLGLLAVCGICNVMWGMPLGAALLGVIGCGGPALVLAVLLPASAIGGGDVKLCAVLGLLLGAAGGWLVICGALILLSCYGLLRRRRALPFAPFVFPAYLVMVLH